MNLYPVTIIENFYENQIDIYNYKIIGNESNIIGENIVFGNKRNEKDEIFRTKINIAYLVYLIFVNREYTYYSFNIIKFLFETKNYTKKNKSPENIIFRKYICSFYNYWDNLHFVEAFHWPEYLTLQSSIHFLTFYRIFYKK